MANVLINRFFDFVYRLLAPDTLNDDIAVDLMIKSINSDKPCLISRIGSSELQLLVYMKYYPFLFLFKHRTLYNIKNCSGMFSVNKADCEQFYNLYNQNISKIDILISWRFEELFFKNKLKSILKMDKKVFDSFYSIKNPWTQALKDKKILVVHPFAETIKIQYDNNREKLFSNPLVLPQFKSLVTIKAVQTLVGNNTDFENWFDALEYMCNEMDKHDYEIAIIGCGAYGFPLAVHAKMMGKKAIHMGGITQFLFGIKGKRYIDNVESNKYINKYFVSPSDKDRPKNAEIVEGGCYW